ncbi:hypothetical protein BDF20DRAFT_818428 [Mycotypha africana]|uniref:uncharacterized protein n=1 Tax=Mycotypha africana TaxID=64632 RepID=UPI0022FFC6FD|nr:uncharacterized protein BDF20DRAFT_818428 [Mycotypha africana]KAI8982458.1 hypothetical protein BDF20DRAFT_818428 [Mycotypha africana]
MNETNSVLSTNQKLQPFLLLSKSVKGAANAKLIMDALSASGVFVFTELYESPNLVEASTLPEVAPYYKLLSIYLYGTWKDYKQFMSELPALNENQVKKLKILSMATLSESQQTLPYDMLLSELDIPTVRELEDLVIDAFYQGVLTGTLDQRKRQLQVMSSMGRDLRPQQLEETMDILASWSENTTRLLQALDAKIASLQEAVQMNDQAREQYNNEVEQLRRQIHSNNNDKATKPDVGEWDELTRTMDVESGAATPGDERGMRKKGLTGDSPFSDYSSERVKKR